MDFVVDQLKFLGLNDREVQVFTAISTFGRMKMTKIASRASLPRTTVDAVVHRLLKQGLISKEKVQGHYEYSVILDEVADKLDWIEKRLRPSSNQDQEDKKKIEKRNIENDEKNVIIGNVRNDIFNSMHVHSGDRVRLMLSYGHGELEDIVNRFAMYTELAIKNNLIFEILLCSKVADALHNRKIKIFAPDNVNAIRLNIVPATYCIAQADLLVFRDGVLIVNPEKETTEKIEHKMIVEINKHLIDVACETGWSVNLVAWLNRS